MSDSPTNTTVWTCPSSSPDPGLLRPTVMSVFQMQHRMTGAAAEDALIHALLLGIGEIPLWDIDLAVKEAERVKG